MVLNPFFMLFARIKNTRAFTLVEMMIVLGIIGGVMAFGVAVIGGGSAGRIKEASSQILRLVKYAYNQAAFTGSYYRIVFDLEEQTFFAEYSDEPFYVVKEGDEKEAIRLKNEERQHEESVTVAQMLGNFAEAEDDLLQIYKLPENIKISDVYVMHQSEAVSEGRAYLYFFPRGMTEFSVIHLSDAAEKKFLTLVVNPLTGGIDVYAGYLEHEEILEKYEES